MTDPVVVLTCLSPALFVILTFLVLGMISLLRARPRDLPTLFSTAVVALQELRMLVTPLVVPQASVLPSAIRSTTPPEVGEPIHHGVAIEGAAGEAPGAAPDAGHPRVESAEG